MPLLQCLELLAAGLLAAFLSGAPQQLRAEPIVVTGFEDLLAA
jgi:hypothetical protein